MDRSTGKRTAVHLDVVDTPSQLDERFEVELEALGLGYDAPGSLSSDEVEVLGVTPAPVAVAPAAPAAAAPTLRERKVVTAGSKRWVFTINNPTPDDYATVGEAGWGTYGMYQLEVGEEEGTPHFQGFVVFATAQRLSAVRKLNGRAKWLVMKGTIEQCITYCTKDETAVKPPVRKQWGTKPSGQGSRTDIHEAADIVITGGATALATSMPHMIIRYPAGIRYLEQLRPVLPVVTPPPEWRPWQKLVLELLATEPNDRTIHWYVDGDGGAGKSTLVRAVTGTGQPCTGISLSGKVADMALAYNRERVVFFDISRTMAENVRHLADFAEKLKNGMIFSTKYESRVKMFAPPHVIFFSNSPPEPGLWSADRLKLTVLSNQPVFQAGSQPPPAPVNPQAGAGAAPIRLCVECGLVQLTGPYQRCRDCM